MKVLVAAAALALLGSSGCAKKPVPAAALTTPTLATPASAAVAVAVAAPATPVERQPRIKDAAVYVDGKIVAFLKAHELPPNLRTVATHRQEIHYGFASYLRTLGVDVGKVRALHLHGGTIGGFVSIVPGDSLRKAGDNVRFAFQADGNGRPRPDFNGHSRASLGLNTSIDVINAVAVYVDKEPPHENENFGLSYPDGKPVDGMAYADKEAGAGTRVYLDGKLVSIVKRKGLTNDLLVTQELSKPEFSLSAYLTSVGIDLAKTTTVDFIDGQGPRARLAPGAVRHLTFAVPARNQGLAVIALDGSSVEKITAIQLYHSISAPKRATPAIGLPSAGSKIHKG